VAGAGDARLEVEFVATADAIDENAPLNLPALVSEINGCLGPAALRIVPKDATLFVAPAAGAVELDPADKGPLDWLLRVPPERAARVVFVPCLRSKGLLPGQSSDIAGYSARIPGGVYPDDVVIATRTCLGDKVGGARYPWASGLARVVTHELGHYLGLHHAVEPGGQDDHLSDTDADNLMHPNPSTATTCKLTPMQAHVVRQHLHVREQGAR